VAYQAYRDLVPLFAVKGVEPPHVTDVDSSLAMLEHGLNPDRVVADITERLPLADGSVELVESSYVLHHFEPAAIRRTLAEANRVLRWGTYLVLTSPVRFSDSFLGGVRLLGFDVDTLYGTRLAADPVLTRTLTETYGRAVADRLASKLAHSYLLIAQKNHPFDVQALPAPELFTFDHVAGLHPSWQAESTPQSLAARDVRGRIEALLREVGRALNHLEQFDRVHDDFFRYGRHSLSAAEQRTYRRELRQWLETTLNNHAQVLTHVSETSIDHLTWRQHVLLKEKMSELRVKLG
jgi:SAM-dependent methyltransferase